MNIGDNALPLLADLEQRGRKAMQALAKGDGKALEHWAELGLALREGRALHVDHKAFGKWKKANIYNHVPSLAKPDANTEVAVMWMAERPEQVAQVRKVRKTLYAPRKLHEAWKSMVDDLMREGDWQDDEQLAEAAGDIGATPEDIAAARARDTARAEKAAQKLADELAEEELARIVAEAALEARVAGLAAERIEAMLARLPEELQAEVRRHLSLDGQLLEAPVKPKRTRKAKTPVEDAETIEGAAA